MRVRRGHGTANAPPDGDTISSICAALERTYASPRHGNKRDPLDELVYIVLSNRTAPKTYRRIYSTLKRTFRSWNQVTRAETPTLRLILEPAGLAQLRARQLVSIMDRLRGAFGRCTLAPLRQMADVEAETFLTTLPGVGRKVAKCVLMYSLRRDVLPVDTHVHRVASRLGFRVKKRPDTSQDLIEDAVSPALRYGFHVNLIALSRSVCRPLNPRCAECCIARWCPSRRSDA